MCDPYSAEEMRELETRTLPTERLGKDSFSSLLAETKAKTEKDPDFLREVLAAADKAAALDGDSVRSRNKVWWPIVRAVVRAAVKVIVKVLDAVNKREKR